MTYEEHYESLIADLNNRFPQLVKKYDLTVSHSGGGCFHIEMSLGEDQILINPYNRDVEYDIPKSNKSRCIFGIYKDGEEEHKTFFKPFEEGLKMLNKRKEKKMSKTFKIIRTETIKEEMIVEAKNEEEAISKCGYENWENAQVLSSDTDVEEVK